MYGISITHRICLLDYILDQQALIYPFDLQSVSFILFLVHELEALFEITNQHHLNKC